MSAASPRERELEARVRVLEAEVRRLREGAFAPARGPTVRVPASLRGVFEAAERTVGEYFRAFRADPGQGTIEIAGERYVLVRAASLSYGFFQAVRELYAERGPDEARRIAKTLLFDMAHVIGASDARNFHSKMGVADPVAKLSAGPVHFAYTGWALVEILPESHATPDDDYCIVYHHPFSFESHAWLGSGASPEFTVCAMSAGYSSGWCQESFGIPLVAVEVACRARGDAQCTFVMAPPHRMAGHLERVLAAAPPQDLRRAIHDVPFLFERKQAEERLREALEKARVANEAKGRFLANVSHEVRTPLTGILGMAALLRELDLDAEQREYVETIEASGRTLLSVLDDVLDAAKVGAGMMTVAPAPCDVRLVLAEVETVLRAQAVAKGLRLDVDVGAEVPPFVESDPVRLRQIVLNLGANAVKFTDRGGVSIRARWMERGALAVEVEDTGIGIDPSRLGDLFEEFTQLDASPARRHGGTGLGLSLAKRFVELLGGEIAATSEPGRGSRFSFLVPARAVPAPPPPAAPTTPPALRRGARVLLVEDDPVARRVVGKFLERFGLSVEVATEGAQGLTAWSGGSFDLVLMDCHMPVLDGYEATRRIRAAEGAGRRTPIVAMTASVLAADGERCREAGMDDLVAKPVDPERLRAALARWLAAL